MNVAELAENLGLTEEEYRELLELLIQTGRADLENARAAVGRKDAEEARHRLHSLKGAAGNLGLMEIYEEAKKAEQMAKNGMLDLLPDTIEGLRSMLDSLAALAGR